MPRPLEFTVAGVPVPQGSMHAYAGRGGRAQIVHANAAELSPWRKKITRIARAHMAFRDQWGTHEPVSVTVMFIFKRPKTLMPHHRPVPSVAPDLDKLVRAVGDSLTEARVWVDDGQVVHIEAWKFYGDSAGIRVRVTDAKLPPGWPGGTPKGGTA